IDGRQLADAGIGVYEGSVQALFRRLGNSITKAVSGVASEKRVAEDHNRRFTRQKRAPKHIDSRFQGLWLIPWPPKENSRNNKQRKQQPKELTVPLTLSGGRWQIHMGQRSDWLQTARMALHLGTCAEYGKIMSFGHLDFNL